MILERLALAVRIRQGGGRRDLDNRRDLGLVLDASVPLEERSTAAPLFAVWEKHPAGPEDVIPTPFGPIHALVLPDDHDAVEASPSGTGVAVPIGQLHHSLRTAVVALRLCEPPGTPSVQADRLGGVHHSTMQTRLDAIVDMLGFDPFDWLGRTRLGIAYIGWRLRHSRVLDLPAPEVGSPDGPGRPLTTPVEVVTG